MFDSFLLKEDGFIKLQQISDCKFLVREQ